MQSPSAMFIEGAADSLKSVPAWLAASQRRELQGFGDSRAQEIGATGLSEDFQRGYELGLQTARVLLACTPELRLKGIAPADVL